MFENDIKIEKVRKVLGEPVICEFDATTQKIRTTLFLLSVISIVYVGAELKINSVESSILGLKFNGLTDELFCYILLGTVSYLAIHFIWCAMDCFKAWRLRITGTKLAFKTGFALGSEASDHPDDLRQSTLYNWWRDQVIPNSESLVSHIGNFNAALSYSINNIDKILKDLNSEVETMVDKTQAGKHRGVMDSLESVKNELFHLGMQAEHANKLYSARVLVSLERFDNWFKNFLNSQNIRWFIIEFFLPVALALLAISFLLCNSSIL